MNQERLMNILVSPHVSEKATNAAESANQIVFRVANTATKKEIKGAIEMLFEVNVENVQVANVKGKTKRTQNGVGRRNNWKKAYIRLQEGQDINFIGAE
ncbi:MAG: 50S ribosomal protein L23 [Gammaproteobacteria bacterium]|jgi:large subunit ribosomal protein L23|nr:50S ribosomal protein L23 [Gammaproteobacteria bacterium]MDH5661349.1 50S ribosomal protein L23 [Gammaproteobacteria bacterium]